MPNTIKHLTLIILTMLVTASAIAQQDDSAFKDDYGNTYKNRVVPVIYPVINDRDYEDDRETYDDDDDPGSGDEGGGTVEDPVAPIDGKLIWLAFAGIGFAVLYFRTARQQ